MCQFIECRPSDSHTCRPISPTRCKSVNFAGCWNRAADPADVGRVLWINAFNPWLPESAASALRSLRETFLCIRRTRHHDKIKPRHYICTANAASSACDGICVRSSHGTRITVVIRARRRVVSNFRDCLLVQPVLSLTTVLTSRYIKSPIGGRRPPAPILNEHRQTTAPRAAEHRPHIAVCGRHDRRCRHGRPHGITGPTSQWCHAHLYSSYSHLIFSIAELFFAVLPRAQDSTNFFPQTNSYLRVSRRI